MTARPWDEMCRVGLLLGLKVGVAFQQLAEIEAQIRTAATEMRSMLVGRLHIVQVLSSHFLAVLVVVEHLVSGLLWNTANQGGLTYHSDNSFVVMRNKFCSIA